MMKYKRDGRWLTVEQLKEYKKPKPKATIKTKAEVEDKK